MEEQPLISVIVPVYNVEEYLDKCVESIVNQTYRNLEIILVDDGSPDNCPAMCDGWAKKDDRIKVIHQENQGGGAARNIALDMAQGIFVLLVDSDDYLSEAMISFLYSLMEEDVDIVECGICTVEGDFAAFDSIDKEYEIYVCSPQEALRNTIEDRAFRQTPVNKLYRRTAIGEIRFPVDKKIDDEFWTYRVIGNADKLIHTNKVLYAYRQQNASVMHQLNPETRFHAIEAKCERQRYLEANFPELVACGKINLLFSCLYQGQMALRYTKGKERKKAMERLKPIAKEQHFSRQETKKLSFTHRAWLKLGRSCFKITCIMRNIMRVGQ